MVLLVCLESPEGKELPWRVTAADVTDSFSDKSKYEPGIQSFTSRPCESRDSSYVQDLLEFYES